MEGKKQVTVKWLSDNVDMAVWRDEPGRDDLPRAWMEVFGEMRRIDMVKESDMPNTFIVDLSDTSTYMHGGAVAWVDEPLVEAAPTPLANLPLVRTATADDMRGWIRSLNLMWTDYDAYTEYDYYLQGIDTDSKAYHNAVVFAETVKAAMDAIKAVIDAIEPDDTPFDQCPKCQTSDKTWLVYERDDFATFACKCGESWSIECGKRV